MILGVTIQDRLTKEVGRPIAFEFDIRYLGKWIKEYPQCFPKYIRENNYTPIFNPDKYRWEIHKGHIKVGFNLKNWVS